MKDIEIKAEDIHIAGYSSKPISSWAIEKPKGIKIFHKPSGLTAVCDKHVSQHMNKFGCLEILRKDLASLEDNEPEPVTFYIGEIVLVNKYWLGRVAVLRDEDTGYMGIKPIEPNNKEEVYYPPEDISKYTQGQ